MKISVIALYIILTLCALFSGCVPTDPLELDTRATFEALTVTPNPAYYPDPIYENGHYAIENHIAVLLITNTAPADVTRLVTSPEGTKIVESVNDIQNLQILIHVNDLTKFDEILATGGALTRDSFVPDENGGGLAIVDLGPLKAAESEIFSAWSIPKPGLELRFEALGVNAIGQTLTNVEGETTWLTYTGELDPWHL